MMTSSLIPLLLLAVSFTLATQLGLWREQSPTARVESGGILHALMGDSRRLFANHFFTKADVYLHSGVYPSIFDQKPPRGKSHLFPAAHATTNEPGHPSGHEESPSEEGDHDSDDDHADAVSGFLSAPKDWIDAFGRNFFPTRHTHLEENGQEKEVLPWLRLAAEMNPNEIQTYTVAAYWLRTKMGKAKAAEDFLREGWRANPKSHEIPFELGRLFEENHRDLAHAQHLYELSLRRWQESDVSHGQPDSFTYMQILGHLARVEENQHHLEAAVRYLEMLRQVSPNPDKILARIQELNTQAKVAQSARTGD